MHGNTAKRTVRHFGRRYDYGTRSLRCADPIPSELEPIRHRAEALAGLRPGDVVEALVNHYPAGAGIGWHTDATVYKTIIGVSLGAPCQMQFRDIGPERRVFEQLLSPRSGYLMRGEVATDWKHRIAETDGERLSLTFRSTR
jgi:alkylated DNA repair protein (DNA oxidative demethylase)